MLIHISTSPNPKQSKLSALIGGIISAALSITGFYIVFTGKQLSGGIPFLSDGFNQVMGQIVIGLGALLTGALAVYAFYELFKPREKT
jgi:hypothetical protein